MNLPPWIYQVPIYLSGTILYTEKTIFPFPFTLNGILSWWQFSFRFWTKGFLFGSKSNGRLSLRWYRIQCERKWKDRFLSVRRIPLLSKEREAVKNNGKWNIFTFFLRFKKKLAYIFFCNIKIEVANLLIYNMINFNNFFTLNFSSLILIN